MFHFMFETRLFSFWFNNCLLNNGRTNKQQFTTPSHQPPFPELRPGFPPNYYSKVINIQHMYKLMVKIINFKAIPCVHIVQLVKTFTEEKMQLITGNIDFVCCQCWKKEKREIFHFPDLINVTGLSVDVKKKSTLLLGSINGLLLSPVI